jgi:hypothetical protein
MVWEKNCWYLPLSKEEYQKLKTALKDKATLNPEPLRRYLEQKKAVQSLLKNPQSQKSGYNCC